MADVRSWLPVGSAGRRRQPATLALHFASDGPDSFYICKYRGRGAREASPLRSGNRHIELLPLVEGKEFIIIDIEKKVLFKFRKYPVPLFSMLPRKDSIIYYRRPA